MTSGSAAKMALLSLGLLALWPAAGCTDRDEPPIVVADYEREEWRYRGRRGLLLRSDHYEIRTTLRDEQLVGWLPQTLEAAYHYYSELVPGSETPRERMQVYLFGAREEFEDFTHRTFGPRAEILTKVRGGGYMEQGITVIEYVHHESTFPVMTHEAFHQYLHYHTDSRIPAWLNEGLAVVCEGQRWSQAGLRSFDKWLNPTRRNKLAEALLREDLFPLSQLLRINAGHVVGGPQRKISTYYAQVWALVLFLQEGSEGRYAPQLQRMLTALGHEDLESYAKAAFSTASGNRRYNFGRDVFDAFFDVDLATLEHEYVAFMRERLLNEKPLLSGDN